MKIETRDPKDLHPHPSLRSIPELSEAELKPIRAGMKECGLIQPLLVDDKNRILDDHSRTLWSCAKAWALKEVPVRVRDGDEAEILALHSLLHRRHLTKSAMAYLAVPLLDVAFKAAREKMLKSLANHGVQPADSQCKTVDELAEKLGVSRSILFDARKVHELFADKKNYAFNVVSGPSDGDVVECTLKAWFEPRILRAPIGGEHEQNRPLGLGGVIAGIASIKEGNRGKFDPKSGGQLELALDGMSTLTNRMLKMPSEAMRKTIRTWLDSNCGKLSDQQLDQLEELGETIKAGVKAQRKEHR